MKTKTLSDLYPNLLEDIKSCMTDPISDILQNFSLEKSEEFYDKRVKEWNSGNYKQNAADKHEQVSFAFASLSDLATKSIEAHNLFVNVKGQDFVKGADWYIYGQNVVVSWHRLKTFDEWLHDWLQDALCMAYKCPEDGARKILNRVLWEWIYKNVDIHLFMEWRIDVDTLKRLGQYEKYQPIEWRDIEEDIEACKKALEDMSEENWPKDVTVLTFKIK